MNVFRLFCRRSLGLFLAALILTTGLCAAQLPLQLWYNTPAQHWMTSALPIGNGELGGMFFGGVQQEHFQFNEKSLWTGSPTKRGAYQSFGDVYIDFAGHQAEAVNYRRELSLDDAIGSVTYEMNGVKFRREFFASYPDGVIVMRLTTPDSKGKLNLTLRLQDAHDGKLTTDGNVIGMQGKLDLLAYEARLKVLNENGTLSASAHSITVREADAVVILLAAGTNFEIAAKDYLGITAQELGKRIDARLLQASAKGYERLRAAHLADYKPLFSRVKLDLQATLPSYPTDELVRNHKESRYLDMLYFQYGRYLMLGSSRGMNLPNNLQGIWNADNTPPWECDIHSNINIQMNYWPAETANLSECHLPFLNYIAVEAVGKPEGSWQQLARSEALRGWTIRTQSNIFGYTDWNINRPANAWYCMHLWQHYAYTRQVDYLQKTAFPVMKSTCEYWFDRLKEDADGKLIAPDEWSPEQGPWEDGVAYAQQLVWQLFNETLQALDALDEAGVAVDKSFQAELSDKFRKLDNGVAIGAWGQVKEWREDSAKLDTAGNEHRHISQLISLYPGNQISYHRNVALANAAKRTLESRGDLGTGWSRAWKIACWARLFDGDHAYSLLKSALSLSTVTTVDMDITKGGVYENLLDSHPPFQIDGNFGATAGIVEMLVQSNQGFIQLLPALPSAWMGGSVEGLRAEGNFTLAVKWNAGRLEHCSITSGSGLDCTVYYPNIKVREVLDSQGRKVPFTCINKDSISFATKKGESYSFLPDSDRG